MSIQTSALSEGSIAPTGEIVRYTFKERACHWNVGAAYVFCLCTGLAFYSPYLYWLSAVGGGPASARMLHPWVGVFFYLLVVWMHTLWKFQMASIPEDQKWKDNLKAYVEDRDNEMPPQGRFNAGQKLFYWVMYYGALLLLVSGLLMWVPEWKVVQNLRAIMPFVTALHSGVALLTIGAFIIHVYMGVLLVKGGLHGIAVGTVAKEWAQYHHRLWYDKVTKGK